MIVVVIIGIIAAIAVPRMSRGAAGAADGAVVTDLATLRSAIDLFQTEHGGLYPSNAKDVNLQLSTYTDDAGTPQAATDSTHIYGPYLRQPVILPVGANKGQSGIAAATGALIGWMVGEIRDQETARVAVQAALTGHLVLATLHTNDAPGAVARLVDMGIETYLLSGALNGAVAQRLARTICPQCATKYYPPERVLHDAGLDKEVGRAFRKGAGCQKCHDSGFAGRMGVYEVFEVTPEIRRMIHHARPTHELRGKMKEQGGLSLRDEGVLLALAGKTSLEEVLRVTQNDDEMETPPAPAPVAKLDGAHPPSKEAA